MPRLRSLAAASALFVPLAILGGCATPPPPGPTVMAVPPQGKPMAAFQSEDMECRQYAQGQTGGMTPGGAAQTSQANSALLGTVLGTAAGALIGSTTGNVGAGAAIGAGAGLVGGAAVGSGAAAQSADNVQVAYNSAYGQCMSSKGNTVQAAAQPVYVMPPPPPPRPVYVYPAPPPPPGYYYYPPRY